MLSEKRLKMIIKDSEPYLNALEEYDRTRKISNVDYKERVNFTIDAKTMLQFRRFCKESSISMSNKVETLIRNFLKENKVIR